MNHNIKVFLHTRSPQQRNWINEEHKFARIPTFGEHVATSGNSLWFRVEIVLHTPFPCEFDAEVYALAENHCDAINNALAS